MKAEFREGDEFHSPENVEKMSRGVPLTDDDRLPWLKSIAAEIEGFRSTGRNAVFACSALRHRYREILTCGHEDVRVVYLKGSRELIGERMEQRRDHYMPPSLLPSQFAALEEPDAAEGALTVSVNGTPSAIAAEIRRLLRPVNV
jgi:carbohydrate kinase (thermoresistant glucokinase family)